MFAWIVEAWRLLTLYHSEATTEAAYKAANGEPSSEEQVYEFGAYAILTDCKGDTAVALRQLELEARRHAGLSDRLYANIRAWLLYWAEERERHWEMTHIM